MTVGTKSVLWGVHACWFHPVTVGLAWHYLYEVWPTWREWLCIFAHDIGYFYKKNMDGPEGRTHPELGSRLVRRLLGDEYGDLTLYHSREYAKLHGAEPSLLAWADKYSIWYDPEWFYLLRSRLSGEVKEFKANAPAHVRAESDRYWLRWYKRKVLHLPEVQQFLPR